MIKITRVFSLFKMSMNDKTNLQECLYNKYYFYLRIILAMLNNDSQYKIL